LASGAAITIRGSVGMKMKTKLKGVVLFAVLAMTVFPLGGAGAVTPEESFRRAFPEIKAEKIVPSPIPGVYEIRFSRGILYYDPSSETIIFGELITKGGRNLTRERRLELIRERAREIPLAQGLKVGGGKHQVIEFSNPDCSFCRKASHYLSQRRDLTRYIFFLPFSAKTEEKVRHILCARDRAGAYEEAMNGKLDKVTLNLCRSADVDALIRVHRETAEKLGIEATPFFIVDGRVVEGADMPAIEKILKGP